MKPRTMVELRCATQANANAAASAVTLFATGKAIYTQDTPPTVVDVEGVWMMHADIRFMTRVDADLYRTQIAAEMASNNKILAGSRVTTHNCDHDSVVNTNCVIDTVATK